MNGIIGTYWVNDACVDIVSLQCISDNFDRLRRRKHAFKISASFAPKRQYDVLFSLRIPTSLDNIDLDVITNSINLLLYKVRGYMMYISHT